MGFLNTNSIQEFVKGQRVISLAPETAPGCFRLMFEGGESLRLYAHVKGCECAIAQIIATPYRADGQVKQSTEILAGLGERR